MRLQIPSASPPSPPVAKSGGYVLIVTLWILVILGLMVSGLSYQVRVETALERRALQQTKLRLAARGAIHMACARLSEHAADAFHSPTARWWSDEALYRDQRIGDALVSLERLDRRTGISSFGMEDEESRLNVNTAEPEQLMGFPGISTVLAESIARFRRQQQEKAGKPGRDEARLTSEGSPTQESDDERTVLVNAPIGSLQELLKVEGVSKKLLYSVPDGSNAPLAEFLTTVSSGRVNVNSAPKEVLTAVGFNEGQVNTILAQRRQGISYRTLVDVRSAVNLDSQDEKWQRLRKFITVRSSTFRLRAVATQQSSEEAYNAEATVFVGGEKLTFIRWREN